MSLSTAAAQRSHILPTCLAITVGLLGLGAVFWPECSAAYRVWTESTAYGHCFLVAPIAAYLAWDRRDELTGLVPQAAPAWLLLALPLPLVWLVAERLGIMEGRQLVLLAFAEVLFLVMLGPALFRALLGPLLYLVFLVPFGAFLTPVLQHFTAAFIDVGLTVLAIPHFSNDMTIEISAGTFFVAEACAGLRFLIASIAFGVFYALLNYRSPGRRAVFIAASIAVPILANGLRALGIVVLGNILGSAQAAAADHIIYGWVFFSIVMLLLVAAGLPMRELPQARRASTLAPAVMRKPLQAWAVPVVVVIAALAPAAALALERNSLPAQLAQRPGFVAPEGCTLGPVDNGRRDASVTTIRCPKRSWTITALAVPPGSTGAGLAEARRQLIGDVDAEDMVVGTLTVPPQHGNWQAIASLRPPQVTGISTWIHGRPAAGGLPQRLTQARDSLGGNTVPPLILSITTHTLSAMSDQEIGDARQELRSIVAAQPQLDAEVARITEPSSPPPRP